MEPDNDFDNDDNLSSQCKAEDQMLRDVTSVAKVRCSSADKDRAIPLPASCSHPISQFNGDFLLPILCRLRHVQPQPVGIKIQFIPSALFLENGGDGSRVFDALEINVAPTLLDRITDQLCRFGLTLGADDGGLFLLTGFVDDECCSLGFLLGNLFGFDGGGEFGGECEMLVKEHIRLA